MISRPLLLLLLVLVCLPSFTGAEGENGPKQCCFQFQALQLSTRLLRGYQETGRQCTSPGVIFTLKNGRRVCADPGLDWVKDSMKQIDQRFV